MPRSRVFNHLLTSSSADLSWFSSKLFWREVMIAVKYLDTQFIAKLGMEYVETFWDWDATLETFIEKRVNRVYGFMQAAQNTRDSIYQQSDDVLLRQID